MVRAVLLLALCAACGGAPAPSAPAGTSRQAVLSKVTVTVLPQSVEVGLTSTATARGTDVVGNAFAIGPVTWSSSSPAVATVAADGRVTALTPGAVTITGVVDGFTATAQLTVTALALPPVALRIVPDADTLTATEQAQLTAIRVDGTDTTAVTAPTWTSGTPAVADVSPAGIVTGITGGIATITATSGGLSGSMRVVVLPRVDTTVHVHITTPQPGAEVGDSVYVVCVITPQSLTPVSVVASVEATAIPMHTIGLGAMGGIEGWAATVPMRQVTLGTHRLVVTVYPPDGSVAGDSVTVDHEVGQEGGNPPGGGRKRVTPAGGTAIVPLSKRPPP